MDISEKQHNFENMMKLAEYAADQHRERRNTIFRIFISYMTLLVIISGLILKYWGYAALEEVGWPLIIAISLFLVGIFITYWRWLVIFYQAADNDVRRRSFYLQKAQVISYYMSKDLSQDYSGCKFIYLNLGNRKSRKITEKCLFKQRSPDIWSNPEDCEKQKDCEENAPKPNVWDKPSLWVSLVCSRRINIFNYNSFMFEIIILSRVILIVLWRLSGLSVDTRGIKVFRGLPAERHIGTAYRQTCAIFCFRFSHFLFQIVWGIDSQRSFEEAQK